jgi:KipI family sensor histidine kinase inhibitor
MARYLACGDAAVTVEFGDEISPEMLRQVRAFAQAVHDDPPAGFLELMPTYRSVTVMFDPAHPDVEQLEVRLREAEARAQLVAVRPGRLHVMPVRYGGQDGPDLEDVARLHDLTAEEVVRLHSGREYVVYCVGFSPGFAYLGGLPPELHTPRLGTPRKLVPAGSVGIGGQQTGVYPIPTPGGWRLLGRTSFTLFDVNADPPCPVQAGDRVLFEAVEELVPGENTRMRAAGQLLGRPTLEVLAPGLFTTVQDLGRWGYQAAGVSVSGAMDPAALRAANALVGNEPGAAALEITLLGPSLRALEVCTVGLAGAELELRLNGRPAPAVVALRRGDELEIGRMTRGARAYLALAGGIEVPVVLGSRSTYTRAGFGGLEGRALQAGDVLHTAERKDTAVVRPEPGDAHVPLPRGEEVTIRAVLGPQDDHFSAETIAEFLSVPFRISSDADRMGYRLADHPLRHSGPAEIVSDGVVLGSIQVPPHGNPIVMLADRPSVGGYPKMATVISADVRLVAQCRPGMRLRFRQVSVAEARQALRQEAGDGRLPVRRVRQLLAAMRRGGIREAEIDVEGARLRLRR